MELPWLKNKKNQGGGTPPVEMERTPDENSDKALLDGAADELLSALDRKDFKGIKQALKAILHMIKE